MKTSAKIRCTFISCFVALLMACSESNADTTILQGVWERDNEATQQAIKSIQVLQSPDAKEFLIMMLEVAARLQDSIIMFSEDKAIIPYWGIEGAYSVSGRKVKIKDLPKEGNDGAYTTGFGDFELEGDALVSKDIDGNIISIYRKTED